MIDVLSEFITVDECAGLLRMNRKTVYDAVKLGELPGAQRVRGAIRIHRGTVLAWFATGQTPVKQRRRSK